METNDEYRTKGAKEGIGKRRDKDHIQNNNSGLTSTIRKNVQKGGGYAHDPDTWLAIGNPEFCFPVGKSGDGGNIIMGRGLDGTTC